jgi:hypothetical protein
MSPATAGAVGSCASLLLKKLQLADALQHGRFLPGLISTPMAVDLRAPDV